MRKCMVLLAAIVFMTSLCACSHALKKVDLGETAEIGNIGVKINSVLMDNTNYVAADKHRDDFLIPVKKEDLQPGEDYIKGHDKEEGVVVISLTAKSSSEGEPEFSPEEFSVVCDDGERYKADQCYIRNEKGEWTEFDDIKTDGDINQEAEIRLVVWLPYVVVNDTALSLDLHFYDFTYTIR